jgi:hypothetical protein
MYYRHTTSLVIASIIILAKTDFVAYTILTIRFSIRPLSRIV